MSYIVVFNTTNEHDLKVATRDTLNLASDCPFYGGQFLELEDAKREANDWKDTIGCTSAKVFQWKYETSDLLFDAFRNP